MSLSLNGPPYSFGAGRTGGYNTYNNYTPQEVELLLKQKYNAQLPNPLQAYQQMMQNQTYNATQPNMANNSGYVDAYTELQQVMSECSPSVRAKIMSSPEYVECDNMCELLVKQALEEILVPQLLQTPNGRKAFENLVGVAKKQKETFTKEEAEANSNIQALMQDEVVKRRLEELRRATEAASGTEM